MRGLVLAAAVTPGCKTGAVRETPDQIVTRVAGPTAGACRRTDLVEAGMSGSAIERRLASGYLVAITRGLYVAPVLANPDTPLNMAVLGVPHAVVSRFSAAALHGMSLTYPDQVHVTAPKGAGRFLEGVVVHETRLLRDEDVTEVRGLAVTSPERTLVDLAAHLRLPRLRHLVDSHYAGRTAGPFLACVQGLARPGVPGSRMLRQLASQLGEGDPLPASELEHRIWLGLNVNGISGFRQQLAPPWYDGRRGIVDFGAPDIRMIIEGDGRRFHDSQQAMADDHRRDRLAARHGWLVLRVTWHEIVHRPGATFSDLAEIVSARRTASSRASGAAATSRGSGAAVMTELPSRLAARTTASDGLAA
ncbi:MAG: very-short-patch-repair endonuclease [Acidimicrobiales bacterium]